MNFKAKITPKFEKDLKQLSKKYPSLKMDFSNFLSSIKENPTQGISLGNECYKIRLAITSKRKGKSGGARIITCVKIVQNTVYLLTIFDKSETETINNKELDYLLQFID